MGRGVGAALRRRGWRRWRWPPAWRRWAWPLAMAAGLILAGWVLVGEVGSPVRLLSALGDLGDPWADPLASTISLLALLAEGLVAYLLGMLALRTLCLLPGSVGRTARRVTLGVTPLVVRRVLDLLVGGTLLAQATLVATPAMANGRGAAVPALAMAVSGHAAPITGYDLAPSNLGPTSRQPVTDPVETRPPSRRASAPLPPWLGGGPSNLAPMPPIASPPRSTSEDAPGPADNPGPRSRDQAGAGSSGGAGAEHIVVVGDTLWDIAAAHLTPSERSVLNVDRYWREMYRANRRAIGNDPDLIHPETRLDVPPFRRDRR
jgi:LysM domain